MLCLIAFGSASSLYLQERSFFRAPLLLEKKYTFSLQLSSMMAGELIQRSLYIHIPIGSFYTAFLLDISDTGGIEAYVEGDQVGKYYYSTGVFYGAAFRSFRRFIIGAGLGTSWEGWWSDTEIPGFENEFVYYFNPFLTVGYHLFPFASPALVVRGIPDVSLQVEGKANLLRVFKFYYLASAEYRNVLTPYFILKVSLEPLWLVFGYARWAPLIGADASWKFLYVSYRLFVGGIGLEHSLRIGVEL